MQCFPQGFVLVAYIYTSGIFWGSCDSERILWRQTGHCHLQAGSPGQTSSLRALDSQGFSVSMWGASLNSPISQSETFCKPVHGQLRYLTISLRDLVGTYRLRVQCTHRALGSIVDEIDQRVSGPWLDALSCFNFKQVINYWESLS